MPPATLSAYVVIARLEAHTPSIGTHQKGAGNFQTFRDAFTALNLCGVSGRP